MHWATTLIYLMGMFVVMSHFQQTVYALSIRVKRDDMYTTRYDSIDVDNILVSTRLLKNYVNCLLDKGPCTADGKELKKYLPDALATECSKCSPVQKKIAGKVFSNLLLKHRPEWDQLTAKFDPDGNFQMKYLDEDEDYSDLEEA